MKKESQFDIINVKWLQRISSAKQWLKYKQDEVLKIGKSYYNCLSDDVDMYGDSYTEEINMDSLRTRLNYMIDGVINKHQF